MRCNKLNLKGPLPIGELLNLSSRKEWIGTLSRICFGSIEKVRVFGNGVYALGSLNSIFVLSTFLNSILRQPSELGAPEDDLFIIFNVKITSSTVSGVLSCHNALWCSETVYILPVLSTLYPVARSPLRLPVSSYLNSEENINRLAAISLAVVA